jgi:sialidase-1
MPPVHMNIVADGESHLTPEQCRGVLVGPGINQPDPFPGYGGFVGWESPCRLRDGTWLVGFSAGYWHASAPTPLRSPPAELQEYINLGLPANVDAPTGGRTMLMRSTDEGRTWSKPVTLIDTPADDRHPSLLELPDGTLLCTFFTYWGGDLRRDPVLAHHVQLVRSFDGGRTWEQTPRRLPSSFLGEETDGPLLLLPDGAVMVAVNGPPADGSPEQIAVLRSRDAGESWEVLSTVRTDHELSEPSIACLPDGRLVMMARPKGDICWSSDGGRTWSEPQTFGVPMYAPSLYKLRDGTLVCLHGAYAPGAGGLRAIFSRDGGETWTAPAPNHGFLVEKSYGYGKAMELPDGSLFITGLSTGGHRTADAQANSIWCTRLRVRADYSGIELEPAPNRQ